MTNRPARFTKEELKRVALVAKELGDDYVVEIDPDGTLAHRQARETAWRPAGRRNSRSLIGSPIMRDEPTPPFKLYRMAEVAGIIGKSLRWLQYHCKANPCGRMAGRTRLFTEADLSKLIASLPKDPGPPGFRPLEQHRRVSGSAALGLRARVPNHKPRKHKPPAKT